MLCKSLYYVFRWIRVPPEKPSDLSTCGIPILQLEHPKQSEHQRLGDIVSGVFMPVFTKTAQRRGTVEQGPHGKVTVGQAIATTEAGE